MTKKERIEKYKKFMPENLHGYIEKLDASGFFNKPASIGHHGKYEGGLFDHSLEVAKALVEMTEKLGLKWEKDDSPYIVGMFHDLCKIDSYEGPILGKWVYNKDRLLDGHGETSVILLQQIMPLTAEEIMCIRWHMGAFETDPKKWEFYGKAIEKYPNVLYTHTADMIASRIKGV